MSNNMDKAWKGAAGLGGAIVGAGLGVIIARAVLPSIPPGQLRDAAQVAIPTIATVKGNEWGEDWYMNRNKA